MKRSRILIFAMITVIGMAGCNKESENRSTDKSDTVKAILADEPAEVAQKTEVIEAGNRLVYLDEVRYYAYNTQATYEAYYMAEGKTLDWEEEKSDGISLKEAVKSTVLDAICEREAIVSCAEEYTVSLSEDDIAQVSDKVETFFSESDEKFLDRVDVSHSRMQEIFEKDALYEKVRTEMNKDDEGKSAETYKNWKKANNVTTNEYWEAINFDTPIFVNE